MAAQAGQIASTREEPEPSAAPSRAGHLWGRGTVLAVVSLGVLALMVYLLRVVLLTFAAVLFGVFVGGLAHQLKRWTRLPYRPSALVVIVAMLGALVGFGFAVGPRIGEHLSQVDEALVEAWKNAKELLKSWLPAGALDQVGWKSLLPSRNAIVSGVSSTVGMVVELALVLFVGCFLALEPDTYRNGVLRLVPKQRAEQARSLVDSSAHALRWWFVGRFGSMAVVGILTGLALWLLGVPMPGALGSIAAVCSFIPYLGTVVGVLPAVLIALTQGPDQALYVVLAYTGVQALEGNLITPLIQRRTVSSPPALLIVMQTIMGIVAGPLGILVATPLGVVLMLAVQKLYVRDYLKYDVELLGEHGGS